MQIKRVAVFCEEEPRSIAKNDEISREFSFPMYSVDRVDYEGQPFRVLPPPI